ncbi:hypothetical protein OA382_00505 [Candidatus Pelagibacter sp.]|nr:hypothetical protein [Candidatus Pelagibacter sp.]
MKILVSYLITRFDDDKSLKIFIEKYRLNKSGVFHDLLICFKLLNEDQIFAKKKLLKDINYIEYIDNSTFNDFDLGSYNRIARDFPSKLIFFLNGNSYPTCHNWLKKVTDNYNDNSVIGTSASNLSMLSSLRPKKFYKFIGYYLKKKKYKKLFNKFPNPHLRTNGFLIRSNDFASFMSNKTINKKEDVWCIESGKSSLTNFFKSKGFEIYVINSDGYRFPENAWMQSKTFNYLDQDKFIISDNQIRKYSSLNEFEKKLQQYNTWGM